MNEESGRSQGRRQTGASCAGRDTKASVPVGKIEYHYGFYAATHAEYHAFRGVLDFLQEQELGVEPVKLDMLIIRQDEPNPLKDPIGKFFRKYNILEYKSPEDVRTILRVSMAANKGIYQKLKEEGPMEDVFKELFRKELTEAKNDGIDIGRQDGINIGEKRGISIGEDRARHSIMERLIAGGISRQQAAAFTGLNV